MNWRSWNFRFRLDARVGAVINLVRFNDGHQIRSVLYQGSLSELFVPYMDPAEGWATRVFIDTGEFYHRGVLKPLRENIDCPSTATYFGALLPDEHGAPGIRRGVHV